jgi:hypothetical protein
MGTPDGRDLARGRATAQTMSDRELEELHAQGASAFQAGAWEVLDEEIKRRARVRARRPVSADAPQHEEARYPAIRATVVVLKVEAALVLIGSIIGGLALFDTNALVGLLVVVAGVVGAVLQWAGAELLILLVDIEANTRFLRHWRDHG